MARNAVNAFIVLSLETARNSPVDYCQDTTQRKEYSNHKAISHLRYVP